MTSAARERSEARPGPFALAFGYIRARGLRGNMAVLSGYGARGVLTRTIPFLRSTLGIFHAFAFDRRRGIDTGGQIAVSDLDIESPNRTLGYGFGSTPIRTFRRLIAALPIHYPDYTFVDVGAGKGRTLVLAAEKPFRAVIGLEFARNLASIASANLDKLAGAKLPCRRLICVLVDAADYGFPDTEPCVIYLYTPFQEVLVGQLLTRLEASFERNPRHILVCCARQHVPGPDVFGSVHRSRIFQHLSTWRRVDSTTFPDVEVEIFEAGR